jgi:translation initiation factor eIF-2B subunit gamma
MQHMLGDEPGRAEFQVVILAGGQGQRMYPLTHGSPKALLPVANRPILAYQVALLEKAGFSEAIIVTTEEHSKSVTQFVSEISQGDTYKIQLDLQVVETGLGTADALRELRDKIQTDFMVMAGDLVTEASLHDIADIHRVRGSGVTMLLKEEAIEDAADKTKKKKKRDKDLVDYVGLAEGTNRVLLISSAADIEQGSGIRIPKNLLKTQCNLTVHSHLTDVHVYIFAHWVLDLLDSVDKISSIRCDLIPYLIRRQFRASDDADLAKIREGAKESSSNLFDVMDDEIVNSMSSSSHTTAVDSEDWLQCHAHVIPASGAFCCRANTVPNYMRMNRDLMVVPISAGTPWEKIKRDKTFKDCIIGEGCELGDKIRLKGTVLGRGCKIGAQSSLNQCVLMDGVVIGERTTLQNSTICNNAKVGDKCKLNDCEVGAGAVVEDGGEFNTLCWRCTVPFCLTCFLYPSFYINTCSEREQGIFHRRRCVSVRSFDVFCRARHSGHQLA